jgi:ATP-dependent Lon protease
LKEKVLAAPREGLKIIVYPEQNHKDLEDIPQEILAELKMVPVTHFKEVLALALAPAESSSKTPAPASWMPPAQSGPTSPGEMA